MEKQSPSMRREWIEMDPERYILCWLAGLPPCGGSGLKWFCIHRGCGRNGSPSMRREWIEMHGCVRTGI